MKPEHPPLLQPGLHAVTWLQLMAMCVSAFPDSERRRELAAGLEIIWQELAAAQIPGELWVDGGFLTSAEEPDDVDFVFCTSATYYDSGTDRQKHLLRQLVEEDLKSDLYCDNHVVFRYAPSHFYHQAGEDDLAHFQKLFGNSRRGVAKGIAVLHLTGEP